MRIVFIEPERVTTERTSAETRAAWASAETLATMGHDVRVVTRGSHDHPTLVIRGSLSEHSMPRAPLEGGWERAVVGFAAAAAKRVWEWHEGDEIDVVEIPAPTAAAITVARGCLTDGPPVVVTTPLDPGVFASLAVGGADATIAPFASPGDRLTAYAAAVARRWAAGRRRGGAADARLEAWRAAQEAISRSR